MRKLFSKKDIMLSAVILLIALGIWIFSRDSDGPAQEARLYKDGELIQTISLAEDHIFSPDGEPEVTLEISQGRIRFAASDCPDQICVHTGFISAPGAYAVCLPHRLMLQIPSSSDTPDAVTAILYQKEGLS